MKCKYLYPQQKVGDMMWINYGKRNRYIIWDGKKWERCRKPKINALFNKKKSEVALDEGKIKSIVDKAITEIDTKNNGGTMFELISHIAYSIAQSGIEKLKKD